METLNIVLKGVGAFAVCFAFVYALASLRHRRNVKKRQRQRATQTSKPATEAKKEPRFHLNKMDVILIIIAVTLCVFTLKMIALFETYAAVPDTLITCVFGVCGGECGFMGWIKTSNEKYRDRRWQIEDENRMKAEAKQQATQDFEPAFTAEQRNCNQ